MTRPVDSPVVVASPVVDDAYLAELEALAEGATEGPWVLTEFCNPFDDDTSWHVRYPDGDDSSIGRQEDAAFIAAARTAVPALCREVRRLKERCLWHAKACDEIEDDLVVECHENEKLRAEVERLRAENQRLQDDIEDLYYAKDEDDA